MIPTKPINIKSITLEYESGTRLILKEQNTPTIGKLFFEAVGKRSLDWKIIEPGGTWVEKIKNFFSL